MQGLTRQILLGSMDDKLRDVLGLPSPIVPAALSLSVLRLASLARAGTRPPERDRVAHSASVRE